MGGAYSYKLFFKYCISYPVCFDMFSFGSEYILCSLWFYLWLWDIEKYLVYYPNICGFPNLFCFLIPLWLSNSLCIFCIILVLLNLSLILWPSIWSVLENIPHMLEKTVNSDGGGGVFYTCHLGQYYYWFSVYLFCPLLKVVIEVSNYYCLKY